MKTYIDETGQPRASGALPWGNEL